MERERLTITLRKDLLHQVDQTIDGANIRNRSHAIEFLISKSFPSKVRKALILAGGHGVKMRPLTYELPKPMIPVGGRPILEHIIDLLRLNDVKDITILTGPLGDKIRNYFGDGTRSGVKINYIEEKTPSGTSAPLKRLKAPFTDEAFFLIYGDVLADINLKEMADYHKNSQAQLTMAITSINESGEWGVVNLRGNRVVGFSEKPHKEGFSKLISAGIFIIEPSIISLVPDAKFSTMEKDVLPKIIEKDKVAGYSFDGLWFDIATPKIYEQALKFWNR